MASSRGLVRSTGLGVGPREGLGLSGLLPGSRGAPPCSGQRVGRRLPVSAASFRPRAEAVGLPRSPACHGFAQTLLPAPSFERSLLGALPFLLSPDVLGRRDSPSSLAVASGDRLRPPVGKQGGASPQKRAELQRVHPQTGQSAALLLLSLGSASFALCVHLRKGTQAVSFLLGLNPCSTPVNSFVRVREPTHELRVRGMLRSLSGLWWQSPIEMSVQRQGHLPRTHGGSACGLAARRAGA